MEQFRLAFRDTSPVESKQIMCVWNNPWLLQQAIFLCNSILTKPGAVTVGAAHFIVMKARGCAAALRPDIYW